MKLNNWYMQMCIRDRTQPACAGQRRQAQAAGHRARGQAIADAADQSQRFEDLVEAHGNACRHVAAVVHARPDIQATIGFQRLIDAQVLGDAAGTCGHAGQAQTQRQLALHATGGHEAVLQAGVFIVDAAQRAHLALDGIALRTHASGCRCIEIESHATGHHRVHHEAVAEQVARKALPVLAQPRELGQSEGQRGVVAQGAEVTQMVGDALAFEQQRTQPGRTHGHNNAGSRLQRHAVSPGVGHGRITADAPGESVSFESVQRAEAVLDAFVHICLLYTSRCV